MNLTELENLHKHISQMSISEFEDWLVEQRGNAFNAGYKTKADYEYRNAYNEGYQDGLDAQGIEV